ncbi:SPOSA6832_03231 [Sporobolomyces salmonicolor]|uniref:SPOSA6832_03231-mRNA-1:cds n=1 Tax=Sporidiobolus salmonicolor TaxID=5005 RepID=A0A0D6END3_SPOSA|nr:SPOSA6832_03231 [Sporobolomyces salmonicolor]
MSTDSFTYLITGASRSLGLGYARSLLAASPKHKVVAAVRTPAKADALNALAKEYEGRVLVIAVDVDSEDSVKAAAKELEGNPFVKDGLDSLLASIEALEANLRTNLYGAAHTITHFLPLLQKGKGKQIFVTSSIVGSLGGPVSQVPGAVTYSISKAAVNMLTVKWARELGPEGFTVIPFHPGYVRTDMNSDGGGDIDADEATKNIFLKATPADNARFMVYDGSEMPW